MRRTRLNYTETNEDLKVISEALKLGPQTYLAGVGGSGDVGFQALAYGAKRILLFDSNPSQVAYIYLRKAVFLSFSLAEYLFFLGFTQDFEREKRKKMFLEIAPLILEKYQRFWHQRMRLIYAGLVNQSIFSRRILKQKKRLREIAGDEGRFKVLIGEKGAREERKVIFNKNKKEITRIFPNDLRRWAEKLILEGEVNSPAVARFFLDSIPQRFLPHFLTTKGYYKIQASLDKLEAKNCDLLEGLGKLKIVPFNAFYFSNLIDYRAQDRSWIDSFVEIIGELCPKGGRILLFNRNPDIKEQIGRLCSLLYSLGFILLPESEELKRKERIRTLENLLLFQRGKKTL